MNKKTITFKTDESKLRLAALSSSIEYLFKTNKNIPDGYIIEEIQLDIKNSETRFIIARTNNE